MLKNSYTEYYAINCRHSKQRESFLDDLTEALAEQNNSSKANQLKQLRTREHQQSVARKLKFLRGKGSIGGTTMVTEADGDVGYIDITDREAMEKAIMNSNEKKSNNFIITHFISPHW